MVLKLFNYVYWIAPLVVGGIAVGLYFLLRNKRDIVFNIAIGVLMGLNIFQHLCKSFIWEGAPFTLSLNNTAYNVCALLILLSPVLYFVKWKPLNQYICLLGSIAGMGAILIPYWYFNKDILTLDYLRFVVCHGLLFLTSFLPLLAKKVKVEFKNFHLIGAFFLTGLCIIALNVCLIGIANGQNGLDAIKASNAFMMAGPRDSELIIKVCTAITPKFMRWIPIVWYALPLYIGITVISFIVLMLLDRTGFKAYFPRFKKRARS